MIRSRLLLIAAVVSGCSSPDTPAEPITLPPVARITAIEVSPNSDPSAEVAVITDKDRIGRLVTFVNSRQDGWKKPGGEFPSGAYTVSVMQHDNTIAEFWPSSGYIGGCDGARGPETMRLRTLTEEDWKELQSILGIASGQPTR